jgi:hypothetical protein
VLGKNRDELWADYLARLQKAGHVRKEVKAAGTAGNKTTSAGIPVHKP